MTLKLAKERLIMKNNRQSLKRNGWMLFFIFISIITLFPFFIMVMTSLKTMAEIQSGTLSLFPNIPQFKNYISAMTSGSWGLYFWNSFFVTTVTVLFALIANSSAGFAFARLHFPGRDTIFMILLLGIMVPPQTSMVPAFMILKNFPLAGGNNFFGQGGTGFINTFTGMILPFASGSIGIFLCRQFFLSFPRSLDDAAEIDGASKVQTFFLIFVPLSKPLLATLAITKANATWNDYIWPLVITNDERHRTVQLALTIFRSENTVRWNDMMAATTLVVLPLIVMFIIFQKYFVQGIITTGMK